jgi:hypothetical protein
MVGAFDLAYLRLGCDACNEELAALPTIELCQQFIKVMRWKRSVDEERPTPIANSRLHQPERRAPALGRGGALGADGVAPGGVRHARVAA